jgi:hypothetical protein
MEPPISPTPTMVRTRSFMALAMTLPENARQRDYREAGADDVDDHHSLATIAAVGYHGREIAAWQKLT